VDGDQRRPSAGGSEGGKLPLALRAAPSASPDVATRTQTQAGAAAVKSRATVLDEDEPRAATVGPLPLLDNKQKHAALVRTCPRIRLPDMRRVAAPPAH
jgi:hypothetical protein